MVKQFFFLPIQLKVSSFAHRLDDKQFFLAINETLLGATISGEIGPGNNGNEEAIYIPLSSRTGASQSDTV